MNGSTDTNSGSFFGSLRALTSVFSKPQMAYTGLLMWLIHAFTG